MQSLKGKTALVTGAAKRIGRSLAHTVGIGTCTVACDHFDTRVLAEPGSQRFRLPIRQEVDHLVAFQIDQNSSVAMPAAPSPIIDSQNLPQAGIASRPPGEERSHCRAGTTRG